MTLTKLKRAFALVIAAAILLGASILCASAASAQKSVSTAQYTNPDTGYQVLIMDDISLLTVEERAELAEKMKPLTEYGHVIFWSTDVYSSDGLDQARRKRLECYGYDSASILAINMRIRKINLQSYGDLYKSINDSKARSITDNVSKYATAKDYKKFADEAYAQMYATAAGEAIAEPMKYVSFAVISLMAGVILALSIAFSKHFNPLRKSAAPPETVGHGTLMTTPAQLVLVRTETIVVETHVSSGGGGGCGGGGGGGGCGGGGGSSF